MERIRIAVSLMRELLHQTGGLANTGQGDSDVVIIFSHAFSLCFRSLFRR